MDVLILSDLHLGSPASRAEPMLTDIRHLARKARRVILNGDTLDRLEAPNAHARAAELIRQAREACCPCDTDVEILSGNHDPAISERHWVYLPESQSLVFHGDCVADCTHPYKPEDQALAASMQAAWQKTGGRPERFLDLVDVHRKVQAEHLKRHPRLCEPKTIFDYIRIATLPPHKPFYILHYWYKAPRIAARLGRNFDRPVRNVVIGHTHRPGQWQFSDLTVLNTGAFMPLATPYAAIEENGRMRLERLTDLLRTHATVSMPARAMSPS
ncbi:MAG TPA: metallophosphoesterase [Planctomycetota bacterium]|nr:metallophosphoesterase [Planctomycetota bacterium]